MMEKRRLLRSQSGVALIEFAFVLPLLILILLGTIELARYAIIHQKLDKTANAMADFVTQRTTVSVPVLDGFADAVPQIMEPYAFTGSLIFTSVAFFSSPLPPCTGANVSCITWQHTAMGGASSQIGSPGGNATLPGGYEVLQGQNAIAAELFYNYTPILAATSVFIPALADHQIYKVAVYKPRQGTLTTLTPP
jgi:hypothetical protein